MLGVFIKTVTLPPIKIEAKMELILITVLLMGLFVAGLSVKLIFKKNGQFAGTCASQSPFLNKEGEACSLCGAMPEEQCKSKEAAA
jgi:hypothetical protein